MGSAGDRPPAGDRPSPGAFPPRRCAATGSGTAGKARWGRWLGGARLSPPLSLRPRLAPLRSLPLALSPLSLSGGGRGRGVAVGSRGAGGGAAVEGEGTGSKPPPSVTAPRPQRSPNPGAEGARPVAALSPLPAPTPAGVPREGAAPAWARRGLPGGPGRPSHGATAPPPPAALSSLPRDPGDGARGGGAGGAGGGADCPQCAPGGSRRRARGVKVPRPSERTGSAAMSATHPTRLETRTKESNTCASQGLARKPPWRNEGEGRRLARRPRWDPEASPVRRGRTTGPSRPPRRGGGARAHVLGPERW